MFAYLFKDPFIRPRRFEYVQQKRPACGHFVPLYVRVHVRVRVCVRFILTFYYYAGDILIVLNAYFISRALRVSAQAKPNWNKKKKELIHGQRHRHRATAPRCGGSP